MCVPAAAGCSATPNITPEVLLASACLPTMFQAIEIDGEPYWDGGYAGNPTMTPLVRECESQDTILVPINPVERPGTPRSAQRNPEPAERGLLQRHAAERAAHDRAAPPGRRPGHGEGARWAAMRMHILSSPSWPPRLLVEAQCGVGVSDYAEGEGRRTVEKFLKNHGGDVGQRSTLNLNVLLEQV